MKTWVQKSLFIVALNTFSAVAVENFLPAPDYNQAINSIQERRKYNSYVRDSLKETPKTFVRDFVVNDSSEKGLTLSFNKQLEFFQDPEALMRHELNIELYANQQAEKVKQEIFSEIKEKKKVFGPKDPVNTPAYSQAIKERAIGVIKNPSLTVDQKLLQIEILSAALLKATSTPKKSESTYAVLSMYKSLDMMGNQPQLQDLYFSVLSEDQSLSEADRSAVVASLRAALQEIKGESAFVLEPTPRKQAPSPATREQKSASKHRSKGFFKKS